MGKGRQKCVHCPEQSIPGMRLGQGLCQYHWDVYAFGKAWADQVRAQKPVAGVDSDQGD
jgi:hypothetical protein